MKFKFTQLAILLACCQSPALAGTPMLDGSFDGEGVWGAPLAVADGNAGWANANARKLYITFDNDYVYFGGEFSAESWQQFIFVVNTKEGGGSSDAWGRTITYNHANKPDFLFRGDIAKSNYMEFHIWDGSNWSNTGINQNASGTNAKGNSGDYGGAQNGFIELRIPKATLGGATAIDAQFIIGGNNGGTENGHGCFDACPNDNNGTSWNAPGNATVVSNYGSGIILPAGLHSFVGQIRGSAVHLQWTTLTENNLGGFGVERSANGQHWQVVGFVPAQNNLTGGQYHYTVQKAATAVSYFRLRITDKDGTSALSKMLVVKSGNTNQVELIGNPVQNMIQVSIHHTAPETIRAELVDLKGRRILVQGHNHPGGSSLLQIPVANLGSAMYILRLSGTDTYKTLRVFKSK